MRVLRFTSFTNFKDIGKKRPEEVIQERAKL